MSMLVRLAGEVTAKARPRPLLMISSCSLSLMAPAFSYSVHRSCISLGASGKMKEYWQALMMAVDLRAISPVPTNP